MMESPVVRVERGECDDLELVALLVALTAPAKATARSCAQVRWLRRERRTAYVAAHSWTAA